MSGLTVGRAMSSILIWLGLKSLFDLTEVKQATVLGSRLAGGSFYCRDLTVLDKLRDVALHHRL